MLNMARDQSLYISSGDRRIHQVRRPSMREVDFSHRNSLGIHRDALDAEVTRQLEGVKVMAKPEVPLDRTSKRLKQLMKDESRSRGSISTAMW